MYCALIALAMSTFSSTPASWAIAGRCSMLFVEQPSAISTVSAFINGFLRHDIARADIFAVQLHNLHTRMLCQLDALRIDCRDRAVSLEVPFPAPRSDSSCCLPCTYRNRNRRSGRPCSRIPTTSSSRHLACCIGTYRLKHRREAALSALYMPCQHRSAADTKIVGIFSLCRCHQKSRDIFITVRDHDQRIKLMCNRHTLRGIRDQITGHQRIFHADMSHRDTVADRDCRKYHRGTPPAIGNAQLDRL